MKILIKKSHLLVVHCTNKNSLSALNAQHTPATQRAHLGGCPSAGNTWFTALTRAACRHSTLSILPQHNEYTSADAQVQNSLSALNAQHTPATQRAHLGGCPSAGNTWFTALTRAACRHSTLSILPQHNENTSAADQAQYEVDVTDRTCKVTDRICTATGMCEDGIKQNKEESW
ncbi:hypothetical protein J6590_070343 [Homalodisca vitripennis]|nr:hypothetical protein J6590_070343 [Homalodisca vitripennis]